MKIFMHLFLTPNFLLDICILGGKVQTKLVPRVSHRISWSIIILGLVVCLQLISKVGNFARDDLSEAFSPKMRILRKIES